MVLPSNLEVLNYLLHSINNSPALNEALQWIFATAGFLFIYFWFGLGRNKLEDLKVVEAYEFSLGRQIARTFYRFLENVIKGKGETKPHVSMLRDYLQENALPASRLDWVCPKVFVLFPFSPEGTFDGSYRDIQNRKNETCRIQLENIHYNYRVQGLKRTSVLSVIKFRDGDQGVENCNNLYAVFAEFKLLITLARMVKNPVISLPVEDYALHFRLCLEEMRRIVLKEGCGDQVEILEFKETDNFSELIVSKLKELRKQDEVAR